jgi:hypothetical protein
MAAARWHRGKSPSHSAQRAEVFMGSPLSANLGVKVSF